MHNILHVTKKNLQFSPHNKQIHCQFQSIAARKQRKLRSAQPKLKIFITKLYVCYMFWLA